MSHLIASQKVIQHYLSALLTEDESLESTTKPVLEDSRKAELNKLLAQAVPASDMVSTAAPPATSLVHPSVSVDSSITRPTAPPPAAPLLRETALAKRVAAVTKPVAATIEKAYRSGRFQALFFSVAGLKVAVPLVELGGIYELGDINSLFGKPRWFKGVMLHREQKLNVVDTACWVMPEKYDAKLAQGLNYQYLVMLGASQWGLCCETLIDTITLEPEQIKWREQEGRRPWMAGLIKEHMCVLVDVDELVGLLNRGLDINA